MPIDMNLQIFAHQAAAHSNELSAIWVALIAGGAAILGASIGGVVSFFTSRITAKNQLQIEQMRLKATLITTERLRWLQDIRTRMSSVYAKMDFQFNLLQRPVSAPLRAARQKQLDDLSNEISDQVNIIFLMLNPAKPQQQALRTTLQTTQQFLLAHFNQPQAAQSASSFTAYKAMKQSAFDALTEIGVETWSKIKELQ